MVETDIKITAADLYDYMLMHTYNSASGIIGSTAGALFVVAAFLTQRWVLLIAGAIILLYLPVTLHTKSKLQWTANEAFQKPLHYVLDDQGVTVSQGEVSESQSWENMVKAAQHHFIHLRKKCKYFPEGTAGRPKECAHRGDIYAHAAAESKDSLLIFCAWYVCGKIDVSGPAL